MRFALNHMTVPTCGWAELVALSADLGCEGVEFRNDLPGQLFNGAPAQSVRFAADAAGQQIFALAEVKRFNDWSDAKRAEAAALMAIAVACGARAVSLIPRNDGLGLGNGERQANLRLALRELHPMLKEHGLIGLVEPLGFEICALRHKAEAVETIEALNAADTFKLVHDTFHHHLAGDGPLFAAHTGIVHISGVVDPTIGTAQMTDAHRVLVDAHDRLGNIDQLGALHAAGYRGPVSFECFARETHALPDPAAALRKSMEFIRSELALKAA